MEFRASVLGAEAPVDGSLGSVASDLVGVDGSGQCRLGTVASPEAVSGQYAEFNLGHPFGKLRTGLSQLACLGVWWNLRRFTMRRASAAGKAS